MRQIAPDNKRFPWGTIIAIHEIGDIQIVEHEPKISSVGRFCPYVDRKDACMSANTLDGALTLALGFKYGDVGAAPYICKLLGIAKDLA